MSRALPVLKVVTLDLRLFAIKVHIHVCMYMCTIMYAATLHGTVRVQQYVLVCLLLKCTLQCGVHV